MQINSQSNSSFGVNLNSPKLRYRRKDFYVKIPGYGRNPLWANKTIKTADKAVDLIRNNDSAENILKFITEGVSKANKFCLEAYKRSHSGLLRTTRDGWECEKICLNDLCTGFGEKSRYKVYQDRFREVSRKNIQNPYDNIALTQPMKFRNILSHGDPKYINNALDYIFELSKKIFPKFIRQEVQPKDMKKVNKAIAEIRWVLAHSTPWTRGSDAISNVYMRAMYKAIGIKTYPLKKGVSLDLEAYCTELSDYKKNFAKYFEKPPEIID